MKKITIALFSILFLATAFLYVLHFTGKSKNKQGAEGVSAKVQSDAQGIAFVNIDSVIYNFDMFFDRREDLMAKQKKAEAELNSKGTQYEKNARDFQDKVNKGLVTRATAAEMEQSLLKQQQELVTLRDNLQTDLMEEEQVMNRQIIEYITSYLEENKAEYNYQYILGKTFGSVVLYGDTALDITDKVTKALNNKYRVGKK
ncbi:MAG TPA: OmpH family outer membrane protein [Bacteroidales bacterium]|jgi:outer membrane protein|nr:OmpH family outer membrane protein [Bacteroidales bacterium]OQB61913.1 MAG: Outer membrane protein (OmpH-like) [Bacteroidetes bacterium ADurb.Bin145]NMD02130.1 OmpH family outer membrane protein [Bacteroidales bacterium]HOU01881.1 OmpH family outer membrane protein [Bacteroidales bacterium]HQG63171.1 OmpH family outer membrane protein [Bacteroidales bacterium]